MLFVSQRVARLLVFLRYPLLLLAVVAAVVAFSPAQNLDFDRSIESMFAADDPLLAPYEKLKRTFGGNEIVLAVYSDEDLLAPDRSGIKRLEKLGSRLKKVAGVKEILSLAELDTLVQLFAREEGIVSRTSNIARQARDVFQGYTHGADETTASIVCILKPEAESSIPRRTTIAKLREITQDFPNVMIAGEPVMVVDGFRYVEEDGRRLGWTSTALLALVIIFFFRSVRWVVIPVMVVQLTLMLTRATLVWGDFRLSMVSSMLTAIVTVIGVATVIHVIVHFRDAREAGMAPRESLIFAGTLLAMPVFWACCTDAVGFSSLLVTNVGPVQDFGAMMAIGSLLALVSVVLIVPGMATLNLPKRFSGMQQGLKHAWREDLLQSLLRRMITLVQHHPVIIAVLTVALIVGSAWGINRVEIESDFTKNFRNDSPIVTSYNFIETNLGGAGVWDIIIPAPKNLSWSYLKNVLAFEEVLRSEVKSIDGESPGLTKVISIADLVVASSLTHPDNIPSFVRGIFLKTSLSQMNATLPAFVAGLHGADPQLHKQDPDQPEQYFLRIMLWARERQSSAEKRALISQVRKICQDWTPENAPDSGPQVTGFFVLLTNLIDSLLADQWLAFGVASAGIASMMFVAMLLSDHRMFPAIMHLRIGMLLLILINSVVTAVIMLVPNAMPIVMVLGLMGWLGVKINMGAAMIAAVSMGLSVDSSIHYISSFRRARADGKSVHESLEEVQRTVGLAVVFSTVALIIGFTLLCTSNFVPTIYFGVLVSLSMLGGLFGNLIVLPLLLRIITWDRRPNREGAHAVGEESRNDQA